MKDLNQKKINYLEKHNELLEKENEMLKKKNAEFEIALSFDSKDNDELLGKLKNLLISTEIAKNTYEELTKEVQKKKQELDNILNEVKKIYPTYTKKLDKVLDQCTYFIGKK